MQSYQIADLFEAIADAVPGNEAVVCDGARITYGELDRRATRLANFLRSRGIGAGDHIGTYLYNGIEYVTTMIAAFKISAVPININYRYVEDELAYLFGNADLKAVVHHREFADRIARVRDRCPGLDLFLYVEDGSGAPVDSIGAIDFETAVAAGSEERDFSGRSNDDLFIIYTGGTTGMPKGVMWPHKAAYFACFGGGDPIGEDIDDLDKLVDKAVQGGAGLTMMIAAPLIHGAAQLATFISLIAGNRIVYQKRFDPDAIVDLIDAEKIVSISLVGDAMARPIADALERKAAKGRIDCSSVFVIGSAGAIFSEPVKDKLKKYLPNCMMLDNYGSTETGFQGRGGGDHKSFGQGLTFEMNERTTVLDDDLNVVRPGSGVFGKVALKGHVPVGYYGDPVKSAQTFVEIDGERYSITGDIATVDADGTIKIFGRGSVCINTGGEKVFIEEVENALKSHPDVYDAVVVGVDDSQWGQRVVALVSPSEAGGELREQALREHCRSKIAGYKVPKEIYAVEEVFRGPNGKADYKLSTKLASELSNAR
jgi:acyl-CoA synthetase (AMP-forming)/AMP-acid ligase II